MTVNCMQSLVDYR